MAYRDLHAFLERLAEAGELRRIAAPVDPLLEIAAITDRVSKAPRGGTALLFERVRGSALPVATNLFGSPRRASLALEPDGPEAAARRLAGLFDALPEGGTSAPASHPFGPVVVSSGTCQETAEHSPDLNTLPVLQGWPGDGRFITLPLVFSRDPATGAANCGMYRVEILDGRTAAIHWRADSGGAGHYREYCRRGERMPVAVALGGDPATIYAAAAPLPDALDEMLFAGVLRGAPVELVRCIDSDLLVPAHAELVIEGYLEPGETVRGGDFGNHTGYYAPGGEVPLLRVTAMTRRRDCVYPATVVGPPPMEDCWLVQAGARLLLPLLRRRLPEITALHLPVEGIFHGCAVVAIDKNSPGQGRRVIAGLWSAGWLKRSRLLVIVDRDVPPDDLSRAAWLIFNNADWQHDLIASGDRLAIDATRKLPGEPGGDPPRKPLAPDAETVALIERRWREYGFSKE
jgi:4-hydroxy-3-polyprenylbenzoate decarboxylase